MTTKQNTSDFWDFVSRTDYVILDTETTGLAWPAEPVQIAVIEGGTQRILVDRLIKPKNPIPVSATAIHGIRDSDVTHEPTFLETLPNLIQAIGKYPVVSYNAEYDRAILMNACQLWGAPSVDFMELKNWSCAMEAYAVHYGAFNRRYNSFQWQSLTSACRQMGIPADNAHTALGDCISTELLIRAVLRRKGF